ncbi:ArfGap-domain-containing protein [Microthyrium microscopicum]|uniref:ArfGap-domain-containing protein n=1 Tax=Microthyrium microscopicum TaxID=703497 RepID=A0A6A6UI90_9PEZI|nr:ArfGap-domain-containing protein [Microthyrium microscopicum]
MSRRITPSETKVEQNRATLKSLVKLEGNKSCADCKRNKHPRWASWNLGIFVCIRCSGIHRGMGTHISRVKSVDLDSWTDEQTQSMIKWGNSRANKYWEAKLAPGHVPSENKIENYIRTKYESKRWTMEGPMPDPSSLDDENEGAASASAAPVERSSSQRQAPASRAAPKNSVDLFGESISAPPRPSTGPPLGTQPPAKADAAVPKQTKASESLLGFDFFGAAPAPAARSTPDITGGAAPPSGPSKADLKQSILSLYSSTPKPTPQPQVQSPGFGGLQNPQQGHQTQSSFGGMTDAFSSLGVSSPPISQPQSKPSAFDSLTSSFASPRATSTTTTTPSLGAGGSFFDAAPKSPPVTEQSHTARAPSTGGWGDLLSSTPAAPATQPKPAQTMSSDLFDLSAPAPPTASNTAQPAASNPMSSMSSAFNLSSNAPQAAAAAPASKQAGGFSSLGGMDAWGSSNVWGAESNTTAPAAAAATNTAQSPPMMDAGWGSSSVATTKSTKPAETTIAGDEDFGGWNSAPAAPSPAPANNGGSGAKGFGGNDDLFGNVWG